MRTPRIIEGILRLPTKRRLDKVDRHSPPEEQVYHSNKVLGIAGDKGLGMHLPLAAERLHPQLDTIAQRNLCNAILLEVRSNPENMRENFHYILGRLNRNLDTLAEISLVNAFREYKNRRGLSESEENAILTTIDKPGVKPEIKKRLKLLLGE